MDAKAKEHRRERQVMHEVALRQAARQYAAVAELPQEDPAWQASWHQLRTAALEVSQDVLEAAKAP